MRVLKHSDIDILSYWTIEVRGCAVVPYVCSLNVLETEGLPWDEATETSSLQERRERRLKSVGRGFRSASTLKVYMSMLIF